jgi:hypothetical protein
MAIIRPAIIRPAISFSIRPSQGGAGVIAETGAADRESLLLVHYLFDGWRGAGEVGGARFVGCVYGCSSLAQT